MVNVLGEGGNSLVAVDYSELLETILRILQRRNPFNISSTPKRLLIDIDTIASEVANSQVSNPLLAPEYQARTATVNFSPEFNQRFPGKIQQIRDCLKQHLESQLTVHSSSIQQFVDSLAKDLEEFRGNQRNFNLTYPFLGYSGLKKQRLTLQGQVSGSNSLLKFHKLTITVQKLREFDTQLREGLQTYIDNELAPDDESEQEELNDILEELTRDPEDKNSDFYRLKRLVDTEVIGQLKKEGKIKYLEYILENIDASKNPDVIYLQDFIRRLKLINQYINDPTRDDGHYEVYYASIPVNLRYLLSRAEAFDALPIVPLVEGYLGETTDNNRGERKFIFGLKLKLNGSVQTQGGQSSFEYHLNLINPDSEQHQTERQKYDNVQYFIEKVLRIFFLYYFVFASRCQPLNLDYNPNEELLYDPISSFENNFLQIFKENDEERKTNALRRISNSLLNDGRLQIKLKLNKLKKLLRSFLDQRTLVTPGEYPRHIGVQRSILEQSIDSILEKNTFFREVLRKNPREALHYIYVGEASVNPNTLCQLPASIRIEDIRSSRTNERQQFSMDYDLTEIKALPIVLVPKNEPCWSKYNNSFRNNQLVEFSYNRENNNLNPQKAFVYRFTFSLLTYTCLFVLLKEAKSQLFIPIVRLHLSNKQNPSLLEEYIRSLSKVLSHLLNEEHLSSSQGFDITNTNPHKIKNGLSSLYSVLPKNFRFSNQSDTPALDKVAIIIVSSRESDARKGNADREQRISNLLGEVVTVNRLESGAIQLKTLKTFSDNYKIHDMYSEPSVLLEQVTNLYYQRYQHFLYIAKAPYSSSLNLTRQDESDEGLFFLSRKLINYLNANYFDINLYPIFFDKYYVRRLDPPQDESLYIQDTRELTELVEDPSKQTVVFFNLFNGMIVGSREERFYNGVISYATLLNIYQGILDDQDIRQGLIYDTPLKNDLLQYLTLFHFSRYEANRNISLKLDPYQNIIGDESVGKLSLFDHMQGKAQFNSLAFLSQVRKALNV